MGADVKTDGGLHPGIGCSEEDVGSTYGGREEKKLSSK